MLNMSSIRFNSGQCAGMNITNMFIATPHTLTFHKYCSIFAASIPVWIPALSRTNISYFLNQPTHSNFMINTMKVYTVPFSSAIENATGFFVNFVHRYDCKQSKQLAKVTRHNHRRKNPSYQIHPGLLINHIFVGKVFFIQKTPSPMQW